MAHRGYMSGFCLECEEHPCSCTTTLDVGGELFLVICACGALNDADDKEKDNCWDCGEALRAEE